MLDDERQAAVLAASRDGSSGREISERLRLPTGEILAHHEIAGGSLVRRLRAQLPRLGVLELSDRERDVIELVVIQRRTHSDAARQLALSAGTIAQRPQACRAQA